MTPDYDLDLMQPAQTLAALTARILEGLEPVFADAAPDLAIVQGDTTTTMAGALAAFYRHGAATVQAVAEPAAVAIAERHLHVDVDPDAFAGVV